MVVLGSLVLIAIATVTARHARRAVRGPAPVEADSSDAVATRRSLPPVGVAPAPPPLPPTVPPDGDAAAPTGEQVASLIESWHSAIVNKNAETVESLDRAFAARPDRFAPALMENAETDPEERVRSFSTRVLGKLRRPESVEVLRRLLKDGSQYVRFNAAWALGELDDRASAPALLRLERHDPSPMVRRSAGDSRRKIEGS